MMAVDLIHGRELGETEMARWEEIRLSNPMLSSPYFSPVFMQIAAATRDDARVGVIRDGSRIVGFFPFELVRKGIGGPMGGRLSDYQGLIVEGPLPVQVLEILKACKLSTWTFDHLLANQACFLPHALVHSESPVISIASGFAAYEDSRRSQGSKVIQRTGSKKRKMEREKGPCRFTFSSDDGAVLETVIRWKSEQCRRTGTFDFFSVGRNRALVEMIQEQRTGDFQGVLSTLHSGDDLVAAHFGMRSGETLHWWFPVYNHDYAIYRPGQVMLLEILREAESRGISLVDLGKGDDHYKSRFMTGSVSLIEGKVYTHSAQATASKITDGAERFLRRSPWMRPVRLLGRKILGR